MKVILIILFFLSNVKAETLKSFSLPIYGKKEIFTLSMNDKKKTLINFWASWCTSCIQEIPELEQLKKDNPNVRFLAINAGDSKRKIKKFLKKTHFSYEVLMDKDKSYSKSIGVLSLPKTILLDEKGEILYESSVPPKKI